MSRTYQLATDVKDFVNRYVILEVFRRGDELTFSPLCENISLNPKQPNMCAVIFDDRGSASSHIEKKAGTNLLNSTLIVVELNNVEMFRIAPKTTWEISREVLG